MCNRVSEVNQTQESVQFAHIRSIEGFLGIYIGQSTN